MGLPGFCFIGSFLAFTIIPFSLSFCRNAPGGRQLVCLAWQPPATRLGALPVMAWYPGKWEYWKMAAYKKGKTGKTATGDPQMEQLLEASAQRLPVVGDVLFRLDWAFYKILLWKRPFSCS